MVNNNNHSVLSKIDYFSYIDIGLQGVLKKFPLARRADSSLIDIFWDIFCGRKVSYQLTSYLNGRWTSSTQKESPQTTLYKTRSDFLQGQALFRGVKPLLTRAVL